MTALKKTPLYDNHKQLKGRMVPFGGFDMPVQYSGVVAEHQATRQKAGLFDVSHMGKFFVSGEGAKEFLNHVTTNDVTKLYDGRCQYTLLCQPNGGVVDDLIITQLSENNFYVVVNASNIDKDWAWLMSHKPESVKMVNDSDSYGLVALQGPQAEKIANRIFATDLSDLKYYHARTITARQDTILITRTGYTGEDGFEFLIPTATLSSWWNALLEEGAQEGLLPCGLGARDTLRLEACYPLYGHELSGEMSPLDAKLGWVIKLDKPDFIGKDALQSVKSQGCATQLMGIEMIDSGIAREGCRLFVGDDDVGFVSSGTFSPLLQKPIAMAFVKTALSQENQELLVDIRGQKKRAKIVKLPFYKRAK